VHANHLSSSYTSCLDPSPERVFNVINLALLHSQPTEINSYRLNRYGKSSISLLRSQLVLVVLFMLCIVTPSTSIIAIGSWLISLQPAEVKTRPFEPLPRGTDKYPEHDSRTAAHKVTQQQQQHREALRLALGSILSPVSTEYSSWYRSRWTRAVCPWQETSAHDPFALVIGIYYSFVSVFNVFWTTHAGRDTSTLLSFSTWSKFFGVSTLASSTPLSSTPTHSFEIRTFGTLCFIS